MGHLVNPISYRLGVSYSWTSVWTFVSKSTYTYLVGNDLFLIKFLKIFFSNSGIVDAAVFLSQLKVARTNNQTLITVQYYDGLYEDIGEEAFKQRLAFFSVRRNRGRKVVRPWWGKRVRKGKKAFWWVYPKPNWLRQLLRETGLDRFGRIWVIRFLKKKWHKTRALYESVVTNSYFSFSYFIKFAIVYCLNRKESLKQYLSFWYRKLVRCEAIDHVAFNNFCITVLRLNKKSIRKSKHSYKRLLNFVYYYHNKKIKEKKNKGRKERKNIFKMKKWFYFSKPLRKFRKRTKKRGTIRVRMKIFIRNYINKAYRYITLCLKYFLNLYFKLDPKSVYVTFVRVQNYSLTAYGVAQYIVIKLSQYFRINHIMYPLLRIIKSNRSLMGYRFKLCGRFWRKERAVTQIFQSGRIPYNTADSLVDYAATTVRLRYSICGIKVWLSYKFKDNKRQYHY